MKKLMIAAFLFLFSVSFTAAAFAQDKTVKDTTKNEAVAEVKVVKEGKAANTVCPVSKEEIEDPVVVEYKGKTYALCCNSCLKKFKKDPEKYISRVGADGKIIK